MHTVSKIILICLVTVQGFAQSPDILRSYDVPQSKQGVAVDNDFFYVINNSSITKHRKDSGKLIASWKDEDALIHHLNSGIIIDGKLYCCNSNYPESPMASSIEIFDPETMTHIGNHSLGIGNGSATWMDRYNGDWYVVFAHYSGRGAEADKDNSWTRMVRYDADGHQLESWIFPKALVQRFEGRSNSGGFILPNGNIYCTGHDHHEVYRLRFPKKGFTLEWADTIPLGGYGQGIAYDIEDGKPVIYGIIKKANKVVVSRIPN